MCFYVFKCSRNFNDIKEESEIHMINITMEIKVNILILFELFDSLYSFIHSFI